MRTGFIIAGLAAAALIIYGVKVFFLDSGQEDAAGSPELSSPQPRAPDPAGGEPPESDRSLAPEPTPPSPPPQPPEEPVVVLPPLDDSDPFVLESLADVDWPEAWLDREGLVRRAAVVIENGSRGLYPRRQLSYLAPAGRFPVREAGDGLFVDPAGYRRYDGHLDALEALPPEQLADMLVVMQPLVDQALGELGTADSARTQTLRLIDLVLEVPVLEGEVELVQPKVFYEYADPALEALSPLQKQLLRMGPDNVTRAQRYALALRARLLR